IATQLQNDSSSLAAEHDDLIKRIQFHEELHREMMQFVITPLRLPHIALSFLTAAL
ncbi:hypothetical protein AC1031_007369, partial [Aphanomyces cochlioides]